MFSIQEMIDSGLTWLFTVCILPLCLTGAALSTGASSADPASQADEPPSIGNLIDQPEVLVPKPPPPPPSY
jgi:hypothetical protein